MAEKKKEDESVGLMACSICCFFMAAISQKFGGTLPLTLSLGGLSGASALTLLYQFLPKNKKVNKWRKLFLTIGIKNKDEFPLTPLLSYSGENSIGRYFVFNIPEGLSIDDFNKHKSTLEAFFKCPIEISITKNYEILIQERTSQFEDLYKIDLRRNVLTGMKLIAGINLANENIILSLDDTSLHTLITGSTGSGKSCFINVLVTQLIMKRIVDLYLIDLKGSEFGLYRNVKSIKGFAVEKAEALKILIDIEALMNKRYKILANMSCKSFKDCPNAMPPVVLIIDEYSVLKGKDKISKRAEEILFNLLSRARACNIIVILATQRSDVTTISGGLKANIKNIITFRMENDIDSEVVLSRRGDYRACRDLTKTGMAYLKTGGILTLFKSYYLSDDEIKECIKPYLKSERELKLEKKEVKQPQQEISKNNSQKAPITPKAPQKTFASNTHSNTPIQGKNVISEEILNRLSNL